MRTKSFKTLVAVGATLSCALFSQQAHALSVKLTTTGSADVVVNDNNSPPGTQTDLSALLGQINFSGSIGAWDINTETATSKNIFGSATKPVLDLLSVNATTSGAANALHIWVTDTGFTGSPLAFLASVNASLNLNGITAELLTFADTLNTAYGTGITLSDSGAPMGGNFNSQITSPVETFTGPYSLTLEVILNGPTAGGDTSFDASLVSQAPDGGTTVELLGCALLGLAALRRQFSK
jgi:hypothetical protein